MNVSLKNKGNYVPMRYEKRLYVLPAGNKESKDFGTTFSSNVSSLIKFGLYLIIFWLELL